MTIRRGDVMQLVDANGNAVASYEYDPYGNITSATGDLAEQNPLRYRGYYYDEETGFYYLQSRYYDPEIGRFINMDGYASTGQGVLGYNMFAYCNDNPVIFADSSGYAPFPTTVAISDCRSFDPIIVEAYRIAYQQTEIKERYINIDGKDYKTYDASVAATNFSEQLDDEDELARMHYFSYFLYERIQQQIEQDDYGAYYTMSMNHIYAETRAHILVWDVSYGKVNSTEIIDLNVDENRWKVLPFMYFYGYNGEGGEYTYDPKKKQR